jgi:hypothetical protein
VPKDYPDKGFSPDTTVIPYYACPHCQNVGCVRVTSLVMAGERHCHFHCPCCHHVWVTREDAPDNPYLKYQPPQVK